MLLYSTFWIRRRDSCQPARFELIHPQLDSFITRQMHGNAMHSRKERIFLLHPGPPPLGPSRRLSRRIWQPESAAATAEDHCCRLPPPYRPAEAATLMLQPSSNPAAPSVGKMVCARRRKAGGNLSYPAWARAPCIRWLSLWQSCWAPCSWRLSSRSHVSAP